jgi:hypothetical protein
MRTYGGPSQWTDVIAISLPTRLTDAVLFVSDIPTQVPPLTPGTNKKMTEALKASFASWEKEQLRLNIVKGKVMLLIVLIQ